MTALFFSDIHGSSHGLALLEQRRRDWRAEKMLLLGDVFLNGGGSSPDRGNARRQTAAILNSWRDCIIAVRGNCDSAADQKLLDFPILPEYRIVEIEGRKFFLSHGHYWNPGHTPPAGVAEVLVNGHTHIPSLTRAEDGLVCFNPGSIALPRNNFPPSFGVYSEQSLAIYRLDGSDQPLAMLRL